MAGKARATTDANGVVRLTADNIGLSYSGELDPPAELPPLDLPETLLTCSLEQLIDYPDNCKEFQYYNLLACWMLRNGHCQPDQLVEYGRRNGTAFIRTPAAVYAATGYKIRSFDND